MAYNKELHWERSKIKKGWQRWGTDNTYNMLEKETRLRACKEKMHRELTPVAAVPVHAQAKESRYRGAFEIIKSPNAYEVTVIRTAFHAFTLSISNTLRPKFETEREE